MTRLIKFVGASFMSLILLIKFASVLDSLNLGLVKIDRKKLVIFILRKGYYYSRLGE